MQRAYEAMVVYDGSMSEDVLNKEQAKVKSFIEKEGTFDKVDVWGRRELAYEIRKKKTGWYCLYLFNGDGIVVNSLNKLLGANEYVMRFLIVEHNTKSNPVVTAPSKEPQELSVPDDDVDTNDEE